MQVVEYSTLSKENQKNENLCSMYSTKTNFHTTKIKYRVSYYTWSMHWDTTPSGISGKRCRRSWSTCTSSCWLPCAMPDWWWSRLPKNGSQQAFQWLWSSEASGIFCKKENAVNYLLSHHNNFPSFPSCICERITALHF